MLENKNLKSRLLEKEIFKKLPSVEEIKLGNHLRWKKYFRNSPLLKKKFSKIKNYKINCRKTEPQRKFSIRIFQSKKKNQFSPQSTLKDKRQKKY